MFGRTKIASPFKKHFWENKILVRLEVLKTDYLPKSIFVYFQILGSRFLVCLEVLNIFRVHFRNLDSRFFSTFGSTKNEKRLVRLDALKKFLVRLSVH